jgi:enolase-phosphatase E1
VSALEVSGIVLDIEGTTTSIAFVYEVLFPYARAQLATFLREHWDDDDVVRARQQMARDAGANSFAEWCNDLALAQVQRLLRDEVIALMDKDAKATGLKQLQGLIWREGFESGALRAHVYDDVPPALADWHQRCLDVRIYSSGSMTAQQLLFGHTRHGDLRPYLRGYYDTTTGPKKDASSYHCIADDMRIAPARLLFFSDVLAELDAAHSAGWQTRLVVRPGNAAVASAHGHGEIYEFSRLA